MSVIDGPLGRMGPMRLVERFPPLAVASRRWRLGASREVASPFGMGTIASNWSPNKYEAIIKTAKTPHCEPGLTRQQYR